MSVQVEVQKKWNIPPKTCKEKPCYHFGLRMILIYPTAHLDVPGHGSKNLDRCPVLFGSEAEVQYKDSKEEEIERDWMQD